MGGCGRRTRSGIGSTNTVGNLVARRGERTRVDFARATMSDRRRDARPDGPAIFADDDDAARVADADFLWAVASKTDRRRVPGRRVQTGSRVGRRPARARRRDGSVRTQPEGEPGAAAPGSRGGPRRGHPPPEPGGAAPKHAQQGRGVAGGRHPGHQRRDARERNDSLAAEASRGARRSSRRRYASRRANPPALARRRPDPWGNRCDVD